MSEINPNNTDAILGGQNPPPVDAAVLGGEIGRKQRLQYKKSQKFWQNFERLNGYPRSHATIFADRHVVNFEPGMEIINPKEIAYAIRVFDRYDNDDPDRMMALSQHSKLGNIEALVFGAMEYGDDDNLISINFLLENFQKLSNLKAIFLGDIEDKEDMISSIQQGNISPILLAYPDLEILQIRGSKLKFSEPLYHNRLKALIIESGGLSREALLGIGQLELPALEYLELWLGTSEYGGDSSIDDLTSIISGEKFPKLKYLGLRNCDYTNDIVFELVKSPFLKQLLELDLSLGTLENEAFLTLINSPSINELDMLDVSNNYINVFQKYRADTFPSFELKCWVKIDKQEEVEYYDGRMHRYCSVRE